MTKPAWSILPDEWKPILVDRGLRAFRADQILQSLYRDCIRDWDGATTLPKDFRETLKEEFPITPCEVAAVSESSDGTKKLLVSFADGEAVETVLIPAASRFTQCISTQAGCAMGCAFCASGANGLSRSLAADEIVAQHMLARSFGEVTNIVVMGMGELAREGIQFELSVSLHAPNDELRSQLMPVNRRWPLDVLLPACAAYTAATKRIITFEYTVVAGVNDSRACAEELARQVRRVPMAKVNLIPLSPVAHRPDFRTPDDATMLMFLDVLMKRGVQTMLRRSRGKDADAACGQLRLRRAASAAKEAAP